MNLLTRKYKLNNFINTNIPIFFELSCLNFFYIFNKLWQYSGIEKGYIIFEKESIIIK